MPPRAPRSLAALAAAGVALAGCGGAGGSKPAQRADRPAHPPPGWRTVRNGVAGFTVAVPDRWRARSRRSATLVSSPEGLVAVTIAADRSSEGGSTPPGDYAEQTLSSLPD